MGWSLFPWQRYVLDVALEVDRAGDMVYDEVVVTVPRQSGKTFLVGPLLAWRCGRDDPVSVFMTAQKGRSTDRWQAVAEALTATPLRDLLKFTYGNTNERLRWPNGSTFRPFPPSATALHGESPDVVIVDEVWTFSGVQRHELEESFKPAWSVKPGQSWLLSTAGTERSEWLNQVRREGRQGVESGRPRGVAYFEWSAPEQVDGTPLIGLPDEQLVEVVRSVHPRRDHGLRESTLVRELDRRPRAQFLRDYGNITQSDDDQLAVFAETVMVRARSTMRIPDDARIALSVAADPDRRDAAIGVAWRNPSGVAITTEHQAPGTRWVAGAVIGLVDRHDVATVAVRNASATRSVADELERAGVPLLRVSGQDFAAACAGFADEFTAEKPSITWDGATAFSEAVHAAEAKRVQSGQTWVSRDGGSITSLDAKTLAVWSIDHAPVPEPRIAPKVW